MEVNGLPLHPLVVHSVVVLAPVAVLVALVYSAVSRWRWLLRWPLVALSAVVAIVSVVAVTSGEDLLAARPELAPLVQEHQERGELLRVWALAFVPVTLLAAWALGGSSPLVSGRGAREGRGAMGWVAAVLLAVGAVGLGVLAFLTGDSGARAVWG